MISTRSIILIFAVIFALFYVSQCRNLQYDFDEISPEAYRYAQWAEMPHKRVPSAGDMMVRFGKRNA